MFDEKVAAYCADVSLQDGTCAFQHRGGWDVPHDVVNFGNKFKWDYLSVPRHPAGRATFANNDFWGMNVNTRHREGAWELLKWLTAEDYWQEFAMKATLLEPCKLSLWERWEFYWQQAAPHLPQQADQVVPGCRAGRLRLPTGVLQVRADPGAVHHPGPGDEVPQPSDRRGGGAGAGSPRGRCAGGGRSRHRPGAGCGGRRHPPVRGRGQGQSQARAVSRASHVRARRGHAPDRRPRPRQGLARRRGRPGGPGRRGYHGRQRQLHVLRGAVHPERG